MACAGSSDTSASASASRSSSQGLERLEYRGYDSAGLALREDDGLDYVRAVGNLQFLKDARRGHGSTSTPRARPHALGDARRASPSANAHPLTGCDDAKLAIVLNGIVENYRELQGAARSSDGHTFTLRDRRRDGRRT